jgi:hypothetical protein
VLLTDNAVVGKTTRDRLANRQLNLPVRNGHGGTVRLSLDRKVGTTKPVEAQSSAETGKTPEPHRDTPPPRQPPAPCLPPSSSSHLPIHIPLLGLALQGFPFVEKLLSAADTDIQLDQTTLEKKLEGHKGQPPFPPRDAATGQSRCCERGASGLESVRD